METADLPPPLSEQLIEKIIEELPTGAKLATKTCYGCWKENKFPTSEFISFLSSISSHSPILAEIFKEPEQPSDISPETANGSATARPDVNGSPGAGTEQPSDQDKSAQWRGPSTVKQESEAK
eukprot:CAMPEP_0113710116 /NCGR_PEP_ID=MMETSP0038_2-20120614/29966_1 /TAXON_ID=2898 /ORGANISM="Cryptomonas paramecium" /LENGTH=122 /DNA_ID=CAMNT_0000636113 /DNA_START=210 /DNA_END=575 /DNA_ORIENTATION=+ /assembly_acc=CAM_ASM_000170